MRHTDFHIKRGVFLYLYNNRSLSGKCRPVIIKKYLLALHSVCPAASASFNALRIVMEIFCQQSHTL